MQFGANFGLSSLDSFHSILIPAWTYAYWEWKQTPLKDMYKYKSFGWSWNVPVAHIQRKTATDLKTSSINLRPIWPATSKRTRLRFFKALSCSPSNDLCSSFLCL